MLNIYVTSSQICTLFICLYAEKNKAEGQKNVLIIDATPKKESLVKSLIDAANYFKWDEIIDLSTKVEDTITATPSIRKRITRSIKTKWPFSVVYNKALKKYEDKLAADLIERIKSKLAKYNQLVVSLNLLTQTRVNQALHKIYPKASINFMEHGTGDYYYLDKQSLPVHSFSGFFANEFIDYRKKYSLPLIQVNPFITRENFEKGLDFLAPSLIQYFDKELKSSKKIVLVMLDYVEMFYPPKSFWNDFLSKCLGQISNPDDFVYILKPHPAQSIQSLGEIEQFFKDRELEYVLMSDPIFSNMAVETCYHILKDKTEHVFSTYSSALFYLSHFYSDKSKFYCMYDFVVPYYKNGPKQYTDLLYDYNSFVKELFGRKCKHI